jgi:hypothetical protein
MIISTENILPINEVMEDISSIIGYELRECKKVEFEIRANKRNKEILEDICFEIWHKANCNINVETEIEYYISNNFTNNICEYRIKLFGIKTPPEFIKKIKYPFYNY